MDTQNRDKPAGTRKFPEPRGWAMKWVFTQEAAPPTVEQGPESLVLSKVEGSDGTGEKFAEPRGWAMKWDGLALSTTGKQQNEGGPSGRKAPLR